MTQDGSAHLVRCIVAAAALAAYGAGTSWYVSRKAAAYRRDAARAAPIEPPRVRPTTRPTARPAIAVGNLRPTENRKSERPAAAPEATSAKPTTIAAAPKATPDRTPEPEPEPAPPWNAPEIKRVWNLDRMTREEEIRYGETLNGLILTLNGESQDEAMLDRVRVAARPVLKQFERQGKLRKGLQYRFTVLASPEPNIFSIPGGFVYVSEGLLRSIPEDQEFVLQFALAHELAHVELGHALECLKNPSLKALKSRGTLDLHYNIVLPSAYFDDQDYAADRWALEALGPAGMGLESFDSLAFLKKLAKIAKKGNFVSGHAKLKMSEDGSILDNHLRAHASVTERLERAKAFLAGKKIPDPKR